MDKAHASHDLNGVDDIVIIGWRGPHEIKPKTDGGHWVTIWAPKRHPDEFWTFAAPLRGQLRCHSDLIGSPSLLTESPEPMEILIPADRIGSISVRFQD